MGTNYYAETEGCDHCGCLGDKLHIGKSSAGWRFHFAPEKARAKDSKDHWVTVELNDFTSWVSYLSRPGVTIVDEYDEVVPLHELIDLIVAKRSEALPTREFMGSLENCGSSYRTTRDGDTLSNQSDFS